MSIPAPENFMGSYALDTLKSVPVSGDPALADLLPHMVRASEDVHSGIHAIFPGPPIGNEGMEMDFDDQEKTDPFMSLRVAQIEMAAVNGVPDGNNGAGDDFDDKTVVVPRPEFDLEETLDEFPMGDEVLGEADEVAVNVVEELGEEDEVSPETERKVPAAPDEVHTKETWPKIPVAPVANGVLQSVDQGTDAFREAVVKALTTDPDGDFAPVGDDEIEVV